MKYELEVKFSSFNYFSNSSFHKKTDEEWDFFLSNDILSVNCLIILKYCSRCILNHNFGFSQLHFKSYEQSNYIGIRYPLGWLKYFPSKIQVWIVNFPTNFFINNFRCYLSDVTMRVPIWFQNTKIFFMYECKV